MLNLQRVEFDPAGPPRYEQLARFIADAIENGSLASGFRLPTVRKLAAKLNVNSTTVTSALRALDELPGQIARAEHAREQDEKRLAR